MSLLEKLGAKNETEAFALVDFFNNFTKSLKDLTGCQAEDEIIGTVTAWKQASITDGKRKENEDAQASATLDAFKAAGIGDCDALQATLDSEGFAAFVAAADKAKSDHTECKDLIDGLVSDGRLAPAARSAFEDLFASNGLAAVQAAGKALPKASQIQKGAAPIPEPEDGLNAREREMLKNLTPEQGKEFIKLRASRKAKKEGS